MSPERVATAVLAVLDTPAGPREIRARLEARGARLAPGAVTVVLRRLVASGHVQRWVAPGPPPRPTRRYELTWRGALAWADQPAGARARSGVPAAERARMAERIRRCSALSATGARLRAAAATRRP